MSRSHDGLSGEQAYASDGQACSRSIAALMAGTIAILANMAALELCDLIGIATAHGGLLKLVRLVTGLPALGTAGQQIFHFVVGLGMALAYGLVLEARLPGKALAKGLVYAALVWVANAAIVLPVTGEGFAGHRHISLAGILLFAMAHTLFFVLLAVIYARLGDRRARSAA